MKNIQKENKNKCNCPIANIAPKLKLQQTENYKQKSKRKKNNELFSIHIIVIK